MCSGTKVTPQADEFSAQLTQQAQCFGKPRSFQSGPTIALRFTALRIDVGKDNATERPEAVLDQERGMKRIVNIVWGALAMLWLASVASATPVTFQGGEFDVVVTDLGGDVYRFVYTADFTGWDDSTNDDFITAIDFGLAGWNDVDSVTMVSDTAPGDWAVVQGSGSAGNCNENTHQFKICAQESSLLLSASTDDDQIYTWTIDVAYNSLGDLDVLISDQNPIKAVFYQLDCRRTTGPAKSANRSKLATCRWPPITARRKRPRPMK